MQLLKFSTGNAKLGKRLIFSLPAGYSCPNAGVCKTMADRTTGKIMDLPQQPIEPTTDYRCFAAMAEAMYPNVRDARWHNWDLLRETMYGGDYGSYRELQGKSYEQQVELLAGLIELSLLVQPSLEMCRVHESGDFWARAYMEAWTRVATRYPAIKFYAYTKMLNDWLAIHEKMPANFMLTASIGGMLDRMIPRNPEVFKRVAYVVYTEEEAAGLGLEIDHDDSHCFGDKPFALLVHSPQRAGSEAQASINARRKQGKFTGYNKTKKVPA